MTEDTSCQQGHLPEGTVRPSDMLFTPQLNLGTGMQAPAVLVTSTLVLKLMIM